MLRSRRATSVLVVVLYAVQLLGFHAHANDQSRIVHDPIAEVATGERLSLTTTISDDAGVDVVRAYFKHESGANYLFVNLTAAGDNTFAGELPAASIANSSMEYLLLVKNSANQVYKSQVFRVGIVEGGSDQQQSQQPLDVFTELNEMPSDVPGFTDNLTLDIAESGAKYGAVTGLYGSNASTIAATTGATNSGTVTAVTSSQTNVAAAASTSSSTTSSTAAASSTTSSTAASTTAASTSTTAATTTAATTSATTAAATTAAATTAGISATTVALGAAAVGGVAAAAGGGGDDGGSTSTPEPLNYDGTYTVEMVGSLTGNHAGDCFDGATLRFTNVVLSTSGSTITLNFGTGTMEGSFSSGTASITAGDLPIEAGTPGFSSTDALSWASFTATWSGESSFTSGSFQLDTWELGVNECTYTANMSGSK